VSKIIQAMVALGGLALAVYVIFMPNPLKDAATDLIRALTELIGRLEP